MPRKAPMTYEQHVELGRLLAGIRDELVGRSVQLANAYTKTGPKAAPANKLRAATKAIDEARSLLEAKLYAEFPELAATTAYYPHPEDRVGITAA